jgi:hypothetical protein
LNGFSLIQWWKGHPVTSMIITGGSLASAIPQYLNTAKYVFGLFGRNAEPYRPIENELDHVVNVRFAFCFDYPRLWYRTSSTNNDGHTIRHPKDSRIEIRGWGCFDVLNEGIDGILGASEHNHELCTASEVSTLTRTRHPVRVEGRRVIRKHGRIWSVQVAYVRGDVLVSVLCSCPKRLFPVYEQFFISTCHSLSFTEEPTTDPLDDLLNSMPTFIAELRSDISKPEAEFVREFFVLPNHRVTLGGSEKPRFIYYEDDHPNLRGQLDLLEEHQLVRDVTPHGNNCPIYRINEDFVTRLSGGRVS